MENRRRANMGMALVGTLGVMIALVGWSSRIQAEQSTPAAKPESSSPPAALRARARAATSRYVPPRTADGQVDLQGIWVSLSATPLERPKALEGRD